MDAWIQTLNHVLTSMIPSHNEPKHPSHRSSSEEQRDSIRRRLECSCGIWNPVLSCNLAFVWNCLEVREAFRPQPLQASLKRLGPSVEKKGLPCLDACSEFAMGPLDIACQCSIKSSPSWLHSYVCKLVNTVLCFGIFAFSALASVAHRGTAVPRASPSPEVLPSRVGVTPSWPRLQWSVNCTLMVDS